MRSRVIKSVGLALTVVLTAGMLAGCGSTNTKKGSTSDGDKTLFKYDGEKVTLKEAWIYGKMMASQYENTYKAYFGDDFWNSSVGKDSSGQDVNFKDYVKEQVVTNIKQIIVLNKQAEDLGVKLSAKDKSQSKTYAKAFAKQDQGKEILKECGADVEDMEEIYEENALASKVIAKITSKVDTNVTDEEARETKIFRIVFPTTKTDESGNVVNMTADEKAQQKAQAMAAISAVNSGTPIEDEAKVLGQTNTEETYAAGHSEEGKKFEKAISKLKDGETMKKMMKCRNGYVVAKLITYMDKDATEQNKAAVLKQKQQDAFKKQYDEWTADLEKKWSYDKDVNQELWAEIDFTSKAPESTTEGAEATTAARAQ